MPERIAEIKARLAGVYPDKPWKYNPTHEMFIGSTNALEMYHGILDLGRNAKEWYEYKDETGHGYRLTEASKAQMARVKALGEFLEQCREDIDYLLNRESGLATALKRIITNCRDADCGDHCSNSCMFCQAREALGKPWITAQEN